MIDREKRRVSQFVMDVEILNEKENDESAEGLEEKLIEFLDSFKGIRVLTPPQCIRAEDLTEWYEENYFPDEERSK